MGVIVGSVMGFNGQSGSSLNVKLGILVFALSLQIWGRDVIREGRQEGNHTKKVSIGLRRGIVLFIIREVIFFVRIFWAQGWAALAPTVAYGSVWPPQGITAISATGVPMLNTILLLRSGASLTWAHHSMSAGNRKEMLEGIQYTLVLAVVFTILQGQEQVRASQSIADSVQGSVFQFRTGFHGIHVQIGFIILLVQCIRIQKGEITRRNNVGLETRAMQWHFVDVVWLLLFVVVQWWGSR